MTAAAIGADGEALLRERVREALACVLDPCSVFNGTRLNFVDLGMVQRIDVGAGGEVVVRLLLDDPVCLYVAQIHEEVRRAALAVAGVSEVTIEFSGDEIWTEDHASETVRATIRERREQLRSRAREAGRLARERTPLT
jgi:metal-sulfur cluster biosynthetic enzyme